MSEDKEALLSLLNSYGQQFMSSFDSSVFADKRKDAPEAGPSSSRKKRKVEEGSRLEVESEVEWQGFGDSGDEEENGDEEERDSAEGMRVALLAYCVFTRV